MSYWRDLWAVLKADGIALDETEAALLGLPNGETISIGEAMAARHGVVLAIVACAVFSVLIQWGHCQKQLAGAPMSGLNYARAFVCLVAPIAAIWWVL